VVKTYLYYTVYDTLMSAKISTSTALIWKLLKSIIRLPVTFILVLLGKRKPAELLAPLKEVWMHFWEAKFTATLICINILIYIILMFYLSQHPDPEGFAKAYLLDGPIHLVNLNIIPFVANWFVHFSFAHLFGNMLFLLVLGRIVERELGIVKTAFVYFGSAVVSGLVDDLVHLQTLDYFANGASGAIAGLASGAMLLSPFTITYSLILPLPVMVVAWFSLASDISGVLSPQATGVANFAHLGGFFAIILLAFFFSDKDRRKLFKGLLINIVTLILIGAIWLAMKWNG